MLVIAPNFSTSLVKELESIPKEIEIDSPYITFPPPNEKEACRTAFQFIAVTFSQVNEQNQRDAKIVKSHENFESLKRNSHMVLVPVLEIEDSCGPSAKEKGYYLVSLKNWKVEKGEMNLAESLEKEAMNIFETVLKLK